MITDVIRECPEIINDRILLNECLTFVRNDKGRAEAMEGKHDDAVISYGIALYARGQQTFILPEEVTPRKLFKWSDDLKQDYYKADKETRERMREKYGEPN
jgi:phage terminase large subunit